MQKAASTREHHKPFIYCSRCTGNILDCNCWRELSAPTWISERRSQYNNPTSIKVTKEHSTFSVERNMRFTFNGEHFAIDFRREYKTLPYKSPEGKDIKSRFPSTTVNILKLDPTSRDDKGNITLKNATVFQTATVGAWHREPNFSLETGRLRALRNVCRTLPKEMKPVVWFAYQNRFAAPEEKVPTPPPATPVADPVTLSIN